MTPLEVLVTEWIKRAEAQIMGSPADHSQAMLDALDAAGFALVAKTDLEPTLNFLRGMLGPIDTPPELERLQAARDKTEPEPVHVHLSAETQDTCGVCTPVRSQGVDDGDDGGYA